MTPQLKGFNRDMMGDSGVWGRIERLERTWVSERESLLVVAGTYVTAESGSIGRDVKIPDQFFKIIFDPRKLEAIGFLMPQDENTGDSWPEYVVAIDDIEKLTGWNFLSSIDEDIQQTFESKKAIVGNWAHDLESNPTDWCANLGSLVWGQMPLAELTHKCIPKGWETFFAQTAVEQQLQKISSTLEKELSKPDTSLSPSLGNVFRALYEVSPNDAKALIMGQDPAPQPGLATGLSFSLPPGTPTSAVASVQRVYLEAQNEKFCNDLDDADASRWAEADVLLLNMALTIPCDGKGVCYSGIAKHVPLWSEFTQLLMAYIDTLEQPMSFILWGSKARAYDDTIKNPVHKAFEGGHPSPKANGNAFFCKGYFTCANNWLSNLNAEPVDWSLTADSCKLPTPCVYTWDSHNRTSECQSSCQPVTCN